MSARCDLTELLVAECACPRHRGGHAPGEELATVGQPFEAAYPGRCERCEHPITPGQRIARLADRHGYVHASRCTR